MSHPQLMKWRRETGKGDEKDEREGQEVEEGSWRRR